MAPYLRTASGFALRVAFRRFTRLELPGLGMEFPGADASAVASGTWCESGAEHAEPARLNPEVIENGHGNRSRPAAVADGDASSFSKAIRSFSKK